MSQGEQEFATCNTKNKG